MSEEKHLIELRRLCCIDDTPKNTESYFIGRTLRWMKNNTDIKKVISYADKTYNHEGGIYSNFKHLGMTQPSKVIVWDKKLYHEKTIRNDRPYARKVKTVDRWTVFHIETLYRNIYTCTN